MKPAMAVGVGILLAVCSVARAGTPEVWQVRTSHTTNQLNGVAYGNGMFVAVGNGATILTSYEGTNWTPRSVGVPAATFLSAAYGNGRYVVGGGEGVLIRSSTDGVHWTNGVSALGGEMVFAIDFGGYDDYFAVGKGAPLDSSIFILFSGTGTNWSSVTPPTTNTLLGICAPRAGSIFVAVGTRGTILTSDSSSYWNWAVRSSGTTNTLRSVVRHQGRFVAGGDHGIILASQDGRTWTAEAPAPFDIRALASSGDALVAVGNYENFGRLQVAADGLTWPGAPLEFTEPLNDIVFGDNDSFVVVGNRGLILQSIVGPLFTTNEWTKASSGNWEEPFWSLGALPGVEEGTIAFRNAGWKALTIGANTVANHASSLKMLNLRVESPADSFNQLLLNWAGLNVPLVVQCGLFTGTNASLVSHYSSLQVNRAEVRGSMSLDNYSMGNFADLFLGPGAQLHLEDATLSCSTGMLYLSAGAKLHSRNANITVANTAWVRGGECWLTNGTLAAASGLLTDGGVLNQHGGVVNVGGLSMQRAMDYGSGSYRLAAGELNVSEGLYMSDAHFLQTGGTNRAAQITVGAAQWHAGHFYSSHYSLSAGLLSAGSMDIYTSYFTQDGGTHILTNSLTISGGEVGPGAGSCGRYELNAGAFTAGALCLGRYSSFVQNGGSASIQRIELDNSRNSVSPGCYSLELRDGTFFCGDLMSVTNGGDILQSGGFLTVSNTFHFSGIRYLNWPDYYCAKYVFQDGMLSVSNVEMYATWIIQGSSNRWRISNPGQFRLGGVLEANSTNSPVQERFGRFILVSNAVINLPGSNSVLEFAPCAQDTWNSGARLTITNWTGSLAGGGSERLVFGYDQFGLNDEQLKRIRFQIRSETFPARILNSGEIVPILPQPIVLSWLGSDLVLDWSVSNGLVLQSATNVGGPYQDIDGASAPYTNPVVKPREFFRLRSSY